MDAVDYVTVAVKTGDRLATAQQLCGVRRVSAACRATPEAAVRDKKHFDCMAAPCVQRLGASVARAHVGVNGVRADV
jgi:hypothetical protein